MLGIVALPFCVVGRDSGDPMMDEDCDAVGEGRTGRVVGSRGALTGAMMCEKLRLCEGLV